MTDVAGTLPGGSPQPRGVELAVVHGEDCGDDTPARALVVGFDRSTASELALREARDLGWRLRTDIHAVHAVDLSDYPIDPDGDEWEESTRRELSEERATVASVLAGYPRTWTYRAYRGDPVTALWALARELDALMIVIGARVEGWRGVLERLVTPSVAHRMVDHCERPVLVVGHGCEDSRVRSR